jgi:hypothetical protein
MSHLANELKKSTNKWNNDDENDYNNNNDQNHNYLIFLSA